MSIDYSDRLSYTQWQSVLDELKTLDTFFSIRRSHPIDALALEYALIKEQVKYGPVDALHFTVTNDRVCMTYDSERDSMFKIFIEILFEKPLNEMPKLINNSDQIRKRLALWRLKNKI